MADYMEEVKELVEGEMSAELLSEEPEEQDRLQEDPVLFQIPDSMWSNVEDDVADFLDEQIQLAESERTDHIRNIQRWKVAYAAPMPKHPKNFPIANSSNLTVPLMKETVNTLAAQISQAVTTARPRWVVKDLASEWKPFINEVQEFLDIAGDRELNFDQNVVEWSISTAKLGTGIMEVGYEVVERKTYLYTSDGKRVYPKRVVIKDGPSMKTIPLQNFWIRFTERDIQSARWVAKEFFYTEKELREMAAMGEIFNVEDILKLPDTKGDDVRETEEKIDDTKPIERKEFRCFEVWLSFDVDKDREWEEIKVLYHPDTRTFLNRRFNPYWHGLRPFVKVGFFPREDRFYDEGLCEMLEQIQEAVSSTYNRRADNATMANLKMLIKRRMVKGLQPGDPLYTGKIIEANDIWNDIREFSLSEIYPSTVNEEMILRQMADRLSGTNEGVAGAAMPVTRTTASAQLALLAEQGKRIGIPVGAMRDGLNEVGFFLTAIYSQFGTNGKALAWMGERGRVVEAIFRLPRRALELGLGIRVNTPTSLQNKQVKRDNSIALFNLLVQLYEKIVPLAANLAPQQLPEFIHGMVRSARYYMEGVMETFDETDPDSVLAGLAVLEKVLPSPENLGGLEAYERGVESAQVLDGIERLERLYQEAEATAERRRELSDQRGNRKTVSPEKGLSPGRFDYLRIGGESVAG